MTKNGFTVRRRGKDSGRGSGMGAALGRKRTVGAAGEEIGKIGISLPQALITDIRKLAAEENTSMSAIVFRFCADPVRAEVADMYKKYAEQNRK